MCGYVAAKRLNSAASLRVCITIQRRSGVVAEKRAYLSLKWSVAETWRAGFKVRCGRSVTMLAVLKRLGQSLVKSVKAANFVANKARPRRQTSGYETGLELRRTWIWGEKRARKVATLPCMNRRLIYAHVDLRAEQQGEERMLSCMLVLGRTMRTIATARISIGWPTGNSDWFWYPNSKGSKHCCADPKQMHSVEI